MLLALFLLLAQPVNPPTKVVATQTSSATVTVTWAASGPISGFTMERSVANGAFSQVASLGSSTRSWADGNIQPSTRYAYRMRTIGNKGQFSGYSGTAVVTTAGVPPPDFTLVVSPVTQPVTAGNFTAYTVTLGSLNGFAGTITLGAGSLPAGSTAIFSPATVTGSGFSTLTVATNLTLTLPAAYTFSVTGTSGAISHTASVGLTVVAPPPPPPPVDPPPTEPPLITMVDGAPICESITTVPLTSLLRASVTTVGMRPGDVLTTRWIFQSGPAAVFIDVPGALETEVIFMPVVGDYIFGFEATITTIEGNKLTSSTSGDPVPPAC